MRFPYRLLTLALCTTTAGSFVQACGSGRDFKDGDGAGTAGTTGGSLSGGGKAGASAGTSGAGGRGGQANGGNAGGGTTNGGTTNGGGTSAGTGSGMGGSTFAGSAGETSTAGTGGIIPSSGGSAGEVQAGSAGVSTGGTSGGDGGSGALGGSAGGKSCSDECGAGDAECASGERSVCEVGASGCLEWSDAVPCTSGRCEDETSCFACDDQCTSGTSSCTGGQIRNCEVDGDGCLGWSDATACATNQCASTTACFVCNNTCTAGQVDCQASSLYQCVTDAQGCRAFGGTATVCSGDTPVCDETDKRCECSDSTPSCVDSDTAKLCSNGVVSTPNCSGSTPVCVDGLGCQPCTEHSQCPASACHLAGSKQGTCFATSSVVSVSSVSALVSNVNSLPSGGERVLKLSSATFLLTDDDLALANGGEVAIIGQSGTSISGGPNPPSDPRVTALNVATGIVYVSRVSFSGSTSWTAMGVSQGAELWVDDSITSGYYRSVLSAGELHVRRSALRSASASMYVRAGLLYMENSAIGPNGESVPGLEFDSTGTTTIDLRYVTIAGSKNALSCINAVPPVGGLVRNSILSSWAGHAVEGGTNGANCSAIQYQNNVADMSAFGTLIPWYNEAWFNNAPAGNFRLTSVGRSAIPTSAARGSADPLVDIDGQSRPTSGGFPGLDQ